MLKFLGLTDAEDHDDPYVWTVVLWAHALTGLFITALAAFAFHPVYVASAVAVAYAVLWEGAVQRYRAGLLDALVDTAGVLGGGLLAAGIWGHSLPLILAAGGSLLVLSISGAYFRFSKGNGG